MKVLAVTGGLLAALFVVGCSNGIPILGIQEDGKIMNQKVDPVHYSEQMGILIDGLQTQTVPLLEQKTQEARAKGGKWEMNTVLVGVGIVAQANATPLIGASFEPRFRFIFANVDKPNVP